MLLVLLNVPQAAPLHPVPERLQLTAVFEVFRTVAVNGCVPFTTTLAVLGATETETAEGCVMVTVAAADFDVSATEVTLIVTVAGFGTVAGAV